MSTLSLLPFDHPSFTGVHGGFTTPHEPHEEGGSQGSRGHEKTSFAATPLRSRGRGVKASTTPTAQTQDAPPTARGVHTQGSHLVTWLTDLRRRGAQIILPDGTPTVAQPTPEDTAQLARYRHALQVAAAGTHPRWWAWISGRGEVAPTLDELPLVAPPDGSLDVPHACATCGGPSLTVDAQALAWCNEHGGAA